MVFPYFMPDHTITSAATPAKQEKRKVNPKYSIQLHYQKIPARNYTSFDIPGVGL